MNDFIAYRGSSLTSVLYLYDIFNYFNYQRDKTTRKNSIYYERISRNLHKRERERDKRDQNKNGTLNSTNDYLRPPKYNYFVI